MNENNRDAIRTKFIYICTICIFLSEKHFMKAYVLNEKHVESMLRYVYILYAAQVRYLPVTYVL